MLTTDGPTRSTSGVKSGSPLTSTGDDEGTADTDAIDASWLAVEEGLAGNAGPEFLHPAAPITNRSTRNTGPTGRCLPPHRVGANESRMAENPEKTEGMRMPKEITSSKKHASWPNWEF